MTAPSRRRFGSTPTMTTMAPCLIGSGVPGIVTGQKMIAVSGDEVLIWITGRRQNIDTYARTALFLTLQLTPQPSEALDRAREQTRDLLLRQWEDRIARLREYVQATPVDQFNEPDAIWQALRKQQPGGRARASRKVRPELIRCIQILPSPRMPSGLYRIDVSIDPDLDQNNREDVYATDQTGTLIGRLTVIGGTPRLELHRFVQGQKRSSCNKQLGRRRLSEWWPVTRINGGRPSLQV